MTTVTDRWWARRESSLAALGRVDSSDAVQGVGTAVLAYHGLSKAVLEPLAHMTLMDVSAVNKALHGLDIDPVAKALGNATRGEMGSASDRYGQLLADDIHATAIESTGRLIASLVQSGVAWPTAIARASKVHGIPADRLGKAGPALRAPVVQPLAADDIADRALMEYASHVGRREATTAAVSKSGMERRRFREDEVVRDEDGRFAEEGEKRKNSLVALSGDSLERAMERQRRRNRKARVARAQDRQKAAKDSRASKPVTLAEMAAADRGPRAEGTAGGAGPMVRRTADGDPAEAKRAEARAAAREQARADARQSVKDAIRAEMMANLAKELKNRKPATPETDFGNLRYNPVIPRPDGLYPGYVGGSLSQQKFMLLDAHLAQEAIKQGGFNFGSMSAQHNFYNYNGKTAPLTRDELRGAIEELSFEPGNPEDPARSTLDDLAIIVFDGDVAYAEDHTGKFLELLSDAGSYETAEETAYLNYEDIYDMRLKAFSDPGSSTSKKVGIEMPHFTVKLANPKAFTRMEGIATDYSKAWQESSVVRDEDGRFAEEGRVASNPMAGPKSTRAERMARRARKQRANDRIAAARGAGKVTIAEIAASDRARAVQERRAAPADRTADRAEASGSSTGIDRKAASEDFRARLKADIKARTAREVKAKLLAQSAARLEEKAKADKAVREDHHEDWKFLDALTFDRDSAHGSFIDMFGMDPYNGTQRMNGRDVHGDSEHRDMLEYMKGRIRPAGVVVDAMHKDPPVDALSDAVPAWDTEDENGEESGPSLHQHAWQAIDFAAAKCAVENKERPYKDRTWMPTLKYDTFTQLYEPWMQEAFKVDEHVVVLGSKSDWNIVMNGGDVELVPLDKFDSDPDAPGQGSFDTLFTAVSDDPAAASYPGISGRSDYYIRAFRIKT